VEWFVVVLIVAAIGIAAVAAAGRLGQMNAEPVRDVYRQDLPQRPLVGSDVETVKFAVTFRGYAMSQVDDLLARLGREIDDRDRQIAALTGSGPPAGQFSPTGPAPTATGSTWPPTAAPPTAAPPTAGQSHPTPEAAPE
jgi:DivIVA domain-containing protein